MAGAGESSDLSVLSARVHRALAADQEVLVELRRFDDEYADLERVVRDLPAKTSHEVMVPFTDVAFYPGRLVHTNELLVLLGADVYAERSATQTLDIIARRRALLADKIRGADASVDAMDSRLGALEAVAAADGDPSAAGALATRREGRATLTSKPDGTPKKLLDVSRMDALGWRARIDLKQGLRRTYEWFCANEAVARGR